MITTEPAIKRGRTMWDRSLLPEAEYLERIRGLRQLMAAQGLDGLVAFGHSAHAGNVAYLTGFAPSIGWLGVAMGRDAGPYLVTTDGPRDMDFLRKQTWLENILTSDRVRGGPATVVADVLAEFMPTDGRLALAGAQEELPPNLGDEVAAALRCYETLDGNELLARQRITKRPREQTVMRRALAVARASVTSALAAWDTGTSTTGALIAAERTARMAGCRDARVVGNLHRDTLAPVESHDDRRGERLIIYTAVEYQGYWAQVAGVSDLNAATAAAREAVDTMQATAGPGMAVGELAAAAVQALPADAAELAVSFGLGAGIGLDLVEEPIVRLGETAVLQPGAVLALQAFAVIDGEVGGATETVRIDHHGVTPL